MDTTLFTKIFTGWSIGGSSQILYFLMVMFLALLITRNTRKMGILFLPITMVFRNVLGLTVSTPIMYLYGIIWVISTIGTKPIADLITSPYSWYKKRTSYKTNAEKAFKGYLENKKAGNYFNKLKENYEKTSSQSKVKLEKSQIAISNLLEKKKLSESDKKKADKLIKFINRPSRNLIDTKGAFWEKVDQKGYENKVLNDNWGKLSDKKTENELKVLKAKIAWTELMKLHK